MSAEHRPWLRFTALVMLFSAACGQTMASPPRSAPPGSTVGPDVTPRPTLSEPSVKVEPSDSPVVESPMPGPPTASIAVEGGDPVVGQLGTFTWQNGGSDSPWLDGARVHVGVGEVLFMGLAEPFALAAWSVSRVTPGNRDGFGAIPIAEGRGGLVRFAAPPTGSWSVQVRVAFAGNLGTALYYWLITVD